MGNLDRIIELIMTVVLIIGGYQFYFWAQRQTFYPPRYLTTPLDEWVTFDPRWVWVYSGLYYPMILLAAWSQPTWERYAYTVGGFLFLLTCQMYFFLRHPVAIPDHWRRIMFVAPECGWPAGARPYYITREQASRRWPHSMRFINTVWSYDKLRNSMPSMHVSVATMVDLTISHAWPWFAWYGWLFPVLIGISAIKTKQHYVVDVIPGALMGLAAFFVWGLIVR